LTPPRRRTVGQSLPAGNRAVLRHEHRQGYEHFLGRCSTVIALFLLGIPHALTPRDNDTLYPRDLLHPRPRKDQLFCGKLVSVGTPALLRTPSQTPAAGFQDVAVIARHHNGTLRHLRFVE